MTRIPSFPRLKFIDFDAKREPKTDRWCFICQKDLKLGRRTRAVRVVEIGAAPFTVHPDDEAAFDASGAVLDTTDQYRDLGQCLMGMDCARAHGIEWTKP